MSNKPKVGRSRTNTATGSKSETVNSRKRTRNGTTEKKKVEAVKAKIVKRTKNDEPVETATSETSDQEEEMEQEVEAEAPKAKRGRKPKTQAAAAPPAKATTSGEESDPVGEMEVPDDEAEIEAAPKAKRGRKPKTVVSVEADTVGSDRDDGENEAMGARKIKRAKKTKVVPAEEEPEDEVTEPVECGIVMTVGTGDIGQLGLGEDVESRMRPSLVTFDKPVQVVCAGGMHTVLLTQDGKIYTFGCNDEGAIGRDSTESGSEYLPAVVEIPAKIKQVSAGDSHTAALTSNGKVFIWGNFRDSDGPMGLLVKDEKVSRPVLLPMPEKVVQIASGSDHLILLTSKGHVYTCGNGEQGQLGRVAECFSSRGGRKGLEHFLTPTIVRPRRKYSKDIIFDAVWAGSCATFARVKGSNDVYSCGMNNYNQLGMEGVHNIFNFQIIPSWSNKTWKQICCGDHHTLGLTNEGEVYAVGRNNYGRLGLGENAEDASVPTLLPAFKDNPCLAISCSVSSSFSVTKSGVAFAWGLGNSGQLGQGSEDDVWQPTAMSGKMIANKKVMGISGGGQHAVLLVKEIPEEANT